MNGYMYILECSDGSYYTGSTKYLELRLNQHQNGEGAKHTKKRLPVKLIYFEEFQRIDEAFYREKQVQGWSRKKKEALINGFQEQLPSLSKAYRDLTSVASSASATEIQKIATPEALEVTPEALEGGVHKLKLKMETKIENQLKELEQKHQVKILYACETGSRAWGFPSPDSDYDVRMIYMHDLDWYLSLADKKDTIEFMSEDGELDVTGWDIKKCLKLMWKSNGALLERVQSPIVYREENNIASLLKAYSEKCFAPIATMHHYLGMAKNSFSEIEGRNEVKLKKLFYALRATLACKWILEKNSVPPIVFITMVNELSFDQSLKDKIVTLIKLKSGQTEKYMHTAEKELNDFITKELEIADKAFENLSGRKEREVDLDFLFKQIVRTY